MAALAVPLIIDGRDVLLASHIFVPNPDDPNPVLWRATGATPELCVEAIESCATAFKTWRNTSTRKRQLLFLELAKYYRNHGPELEAIILEEIFCGPAWANVNLNDIIDMADQAAALCTSGVLNARVPDVSQPGSHAVIYKAPLGVILGMAPWNAPATLGLRSVLAAVATGNTVILKGSEFSPRTHYFIANSFRAAGFPPGVVNFVLHRPQDGPATFEAMISHPAVRKCNFTGSTQVGRHIALTAASYLKPVLMELGGKNFAIVLDDANLDQAARCILAGAYLNNGQICMSTDIVLVTETNKPALVQRLREQLPACVAHFNRIIHKNSSDRILSLVKDAQKKGATAYNVPGLSAGHCEITFLEGVTTDMRFWNEEAFGPIFGLATIKNADEAVEFVNRCPYGLSSAIFTTTGLAAITLARRLEVGSVHVNGATAHDEASLPHGGVKNSGWGRFGSHWGFNEFIQTQAVILNE